MRPTSSTMLQQNNNNNYPCLNVSASTREMLQKCSRSSLPFPSRLELGLGDLPLIKGLRTWALCSRNRRKAGGLLGGGQAPTAPPAGRGSSSSCPRPADVYLSEEWSRMGYGLPLDNRQTGIGALVTVATLKTSEGGGKTQTQCLFLRTEKGSCLYSTAKPGPGLTSNVVAGWLRGKTGGGSRDGPAGRRDNGTTLPAQTGTNRVRVRSGRRWRKSGNAAERAFPKQQRSREGAAGESALEERQEERDKGGVPVHSLDSRQLPCPLQGSKQASQEQDGACRSPRCCHNTLAAPCTRCGRREQRREDREDREGGGGPTNVQNGLNNEVKGMRKERHKRAEEEEEDSLSAVPNSDPFYPECHSVNVERKVTESNEAAEEQTGHSEDFCSSKEADANSSTKAVKTQTGSSDGHSDGRSRDAAGTTCDAGETVEEEREGNDICEHETLHQPSESHQRVKDEEEAAAGTQTLHQFPLRSVCYERDAVCLTTVSLSKATEPSPPAGGATASAESQSCSDQEEGGSSRRESLHKRIREEDLEQDEEEADAKADEVSCRGVKETLREPACEASQEEERKVLFLLQKEEAEGQQQERRASSSSLPLVAQRILTEPSGDTEGRRRGEEWTKEGREEETSKPGEEKETAEKGRREEGEGREDEEEEERCAEGQRDEAERERGCEDVNKACVLRVDGQTTQEVDLGRECVCDPAAPLVEGRGSERGRKVEEDRENGESGLPLPPSPRAAHVSLTSGTLSPANPAPPLRPPEAMATALPRLEAEGVRAEEREDEDGSSRGGRRGQEREEREERSQAAWSSTVATERSHKEEEEEEEEEDEFGVFIQAEGETAWSEGVTMSASVTPQSRQSSALGNHAVAGESTYWTSGWTDGSFQQEEEEEEEEDSWTAFPQQPLDKSGDKVGQWWPEERTDGSSANQNLAAVFSEAFPSLAGPSCDPRDPDAVPTLAQFLRSNQQHSRASQDQRLLDSFHDLNKMIVQRYKRATGVSCDLLLKTLHLENINHTENRTGPWTANRRLSPGLPSANQHAQHAAAKRRSSYDHNRNAME
ncbi:uncharacterized protein LOC143007322 isoform X2 [Genypterus blacodes]|uniref:uncharacterized protein LOC143007322 isoform X2 n=1 Tax=Genypterus blacodes TaxID=154954 RepID=UPI003F759BE3